MKISFLQWNIWYKEDPDNIITEIKKINPDVICAQEFIQHSGQKPPLDTAKYIAEGLGYNYFFYPAEKWTGRPEKETQGNAIFSKFPIVKTNHYYVRQPKTNPINATEEGRVIVEATIEKDGQEISFGTTHLSLSHHFVMNDNRKEEGQNLLDYLKTKKTAYVFSGDLNALPDSFIIKGLSEGMNNLGPNFSEKTWTTKPFDYHGFKENDLAWRLDYSFATKDITPIRSEVIQTEFSDHLPLFSEFEI
jgi:endonuclease/exonuclease/phosphatase family metal-dependent hydrolase